MAAPFAIAGADVEIRGRAPSLGEHGRELLAEAGYEPDQVDRLIADGVVAELPADVAG